MSNFSFVRDGYNPETDHTEGWHRPHDALPPLAPESIGDRKESIEVLVATPGWLGIEPLVSIASHIHWEDEEPYWMTDGGGQSLSGLLAGASPPQSRRTGKASSDHITPQEWTMKNTNTDERRKPKGREAAFQTPRRSRKRFDMWRASESPMSFPDWLSERAGRQAVAR